MSFTQSTAYTVWLYLTMFLGIIFEWIILQKIYQTVKERLGVK